MKIRVAIHQPNFFPWLGFFQKWAKSDIFILLDDVQIPLKGGSWTNRTQISHAGERRWLTVPIVRESVVNKKLSDVKLIPGTAWKRRANGQLQHSYSKCNFAQESIELLGSNLEPDIQNLLQLNLRGLRQAGGMLQLDWDRVVIASSLGVKSSGTQRLIDIVKAVGGDTYLSGDGSEGYQNNDAFAEAGLRLEFLNFVHPKYDQRGADIFTPGLSILDTIANLGSAGTSSLLFSGGKS
jgi:hypothetical protein